MADEVGGAGRVGGEPPGAVAGGSLPSFARQLERYVILRKVGQGGMGAVYEAEQVSPHRRVALKMLRPSAMGEEQARRFRNEAEILGRLQHPGIAQVFEAGAFETEEGTQPFFAMEFIDGLPLLEHAREAGLGTRDRLQLFAQICDAVSYAHQKGVIHRDLKPDNVLVLNATTTAEHDSTTSLVIGRAKVLDFGIARVTDSDMELATMSTELGTIVGTLQYMSPEQTMGRRESVDHRTDIYSLGVMLYQLLSGEMPYDLVGREILGAINTIQEQEPRPLGRVDAKFRGDLETIVGKCLAKEAGHRYESAQELAMDLRRYLRDEPILARAPSTFYQLRKFARRNTGLVAGIAAALLILVAGTVVSIVFATRANAEAERANIAAEQAKAEAVRATREQAKAERVKSFVTAMLDGITPETAQGLDTKLLRLIVDRSASRVESELASQPQVEAEIRDLLGRVYGSIGDYDDAEHNLTRAEAIFADALGPEAPQTLHSRAKLAALTLDSEGRHALAERRLRAVYDDQVRVLGPEHRDTLETGQRLAQALMMQGKAGEGEQLLLDLAERAEDALGPDDPRCTSIAMDLGVLYSQTDRRDQAEAVFRECLAIHERVLGPDHPSTIAAMADLVMMLGPEKNREDTERLHREVIARCERVFGADHPQTLKVENNYAGYLSDAGRPEEALALNEQVYASRCRVLGEQHALTLYSLRNIGVDLKQLGRFDEAEQRLRQVLALRLQVHGPEHREVAQSYSDLALLFHAQGRLDEAAAMFGEVAKIVLKLGSDSDPHVALSFYHWAAVTQDSGDDAAALPIYRRAIQLNDERKGGDRAYIAAAWNGLAKALAATGDAAQADEAFRNGLAMRERLFGEKHPELVLSLNDYVQFLLERERFADAEPFAGRLLAMVQSIEPQNAVALARSEHFLGVAFAGQGRYAEARGPLLDSWEELQKVPDAARETRVRYLESLVRLFEALGDAEQTASWGARLRAEQGPG